MTGGGLETLLRRLARGTYDKTPIVEEMSGSFLTFLMIDAIPAINRTRVADDELLQYGVNFGKTSAKDDRAKNVFWLFAPLPANGGEPVIRILSVEQVLEDLSDLVLPA